MKLFDAQGLPKDGRAGPAGANGTSGAQGPAGPALFMLAEDGEDGLTIPGPPGATGPQGPAGSSGSGGGSTLVFMFGDDGADGDPGPPGPAGSSAASTTTLSAAILADSPFAFYKCDDASTKLADSSGNAFDLTTVSGSPNYASTIFIPTLPATALANVGGVNNSSVSAGWERASALGRTLPLTTWTIEFVLVATVNAASTFRVIDWRTSSTTIIVNVYWLSGILNIAFNNANNAITTPSLVVGKPVHVTITCSTTSGTSTLNAYYNGILVGTTTASASTASGGSPAFAVATGATYGGATASESIGYVALFPTVLSLARIAAHASAAGLLGL